MVKLPPGWGRFGAGGQHGDLGAQVLSVIEVDSGHPNAGADGHNLKGNVLADSWWILDTYLNMF